MVQPLDIRSSRYRYVRAGRSSLVTGWGQIVCSPTFYPNAEMECTLACNLTLIRIFGSGFTLIDPMRGQIRSSYQGYMGFTA